MMTKCEWWFLFLFFMHQQTADSRIHFLFVCAYKQVFQRWHYLINDTCTSFFVVFLIFLGICFLGPWNILLHVFVRLSVNLLHENQSVNLTMQFFIVLNIRWISFPWIKSAVSSANRRILISFTAFIISLIYIINNNGPSTEPWGT